ncbi:MAG: hypothetical protein GFH27_549279n368 [Chloroflexi bacterium AL-W]|nr:hypothetical protein [Chloroflexi bacterium AL-N1]NOK65334.1 hypothetical protein [Chloroflexi bacterium AL-N10]NOK72401.1 hypothetical protein [Chloroflexi bacterium AL-N5]NOK79513.1 hypothetical protein [Chloroflexi bacterium AL-W]NOK87429.1 hypothetical protein [Chloroflexi bacterium AL-N15]
MATRGAQTMFSALLTCSVTTTLNNMMDGNGLDYDNLVYVHCSIPVNKKL